MLAGPEALDLYEVAAIMTEVLGRTIRYTNPSFPAFWWRLGRRGVSWDTLFFMTMVYTLARTGKNEVEGAELLPRLLGRPATTMRTFVEENRFRWERREWT